MSGSGHQEFLENYILTFLPVSKSAKKVAFVGVGIPSRSDIKWNLYLFQLFFQFFFIWRLIRVD